MTRFFEKLSEARFIVLMTVISILPMMLIGLMAQHILFETIRTERIKTLGQVADAKHDQLTMVLKRAHDRAKVVLSNLAFQCNVYQFNEACSASILKLYVLSEEANGATLYGKMNSKSLVVGDSAVGSHEIVSFQTGQYARIFGKSNDPKRSYFISVINAGYQLSVTYPVSNLQPIFDRPPDVGSMGETFLADGEGYFVTEARYPSAQGHQSHPINAHPMQSCLSGESKEVLDLDYRDKSVIHGFRFIPELGSGCIMAHADQEEAFSGLTAFERKANFIILISAAGIIMLSVYMARRFLRIQESQRQSENKFRFLYDNANDGMHILDMQGVILDINHIGHTRLGYTREEMIGKPITEFVSASMGQKVPTLMKALIEQGRLLFESAHICKDGKILPMEIGAKIIEQNGQKLIFSINRDITMRKEIENMLSKRLTKYQAVIETSNDGFWIVDMQAHLIEVNDAYVKLSGYSREELLSMSVPDLEHIESSEDTAAHIEKVIRDGHDRFESYHKTKDGKIWPVEIVVNYWNIEDGRLFVFIHDITERNKILKDLAHSRQNREYILENAPISMAICRSDGRLIFNNEAMCHLLGYTKEEFLKLSVKDITYKEDQELTSTYIKQLVSGQLKVFSGEKRYVRKDGQIVWAFMTATAYVEISGEMFLIAQIEDITQRKVMEESLKESEERFRIIFETANDSILVLDMEGCIFDLNPFAYVHLGYTREEMIGKRISEFVAPEFRPKVPERIATLKSEGHAIFESTMMRKDQTTIFIEVNARMIEKNGKKVIFSINRDITERKQIEKIMLEREALSRAVIERILDN